MNAIVESRKEEIAAFCRKWSVSEFSFFGSVVRDDFGPKSDIDVLVTFVPKAKIGLGEMVEMRAELVKMFGRKVDLIEEAALRNPYRRKNILSDKRVVYEKKS